MCWRSILVRFPNHLTWLLSMWRSNGSTLSCSWMTKLLAVSLRLSLMKPEGPYHGLKAETWSWDWHAYTLLLCACLKIQSKEDLNRMDDKWKPWHSQGTIWTYCHLVKSHQCGVKWSATKSVKCRVSKSTDITIWASALISQNIELFV